MDSDPDVKRGPCYGCSCGVGDCCRSETAENDGDVEGGDAATTDAERSKSADKKSAVMVAIILVMRSKHKCRGKGSQAVDNSQKYHIGKQRDVDRAVRGTWEHSDGLFCAGRASCQVDLAASLPTKTHHLSCEFRLGSRDTHDWQHDTQMDETSFFDTLVHSRERPTPQTHAHAHALVRSRTASLCGHARRY